MNKKTDEIPDKIAWDTLIGCNKDLGERMQQLESKIAAIMKVIESELKEIPKLQDFASGHGDAEGYARVCGQEVLLKRLFEKFSRIIK